MLQPAKAASSSPGRIRPLADRRTPKRAIVRENSDGFLELKHCLWPPIFAMDRLIGAMQAARLDLVRLFRRNAPLHVDLGCGDGSFLCEMAQQFPKRNFLGIERLTKRVEKVRRKAEKIENVRVLRAETLFAVRYLLPECSVAAFYLLFPDPWPKRRHQFRRIFNGDFLDSVAVALEKHGILRVATDQLDYFHQIERLSRAHLQLQIVPQSPDEAVLPITKFERKFREYGLPIYRLTLRKSSPVR